LVPLSENPDYVEEKTGARPGSGWGLFFRLNPNVDDVVERFGVVAPDEVRLLVMGNTVQPAAGCVCPENTLLAAVANAVSLRRGEAILLDTQAGIEHFGRALAQGFRHAVVMTDPTFNGVQVALHAARLARELGIPAIHLVVNRVRNASDVGRVSDMLEEHGGFPFTTRHVLPYEEQLLRSEPDVGPLLSGPDSAFLHAVGELRNALLQVELERWRHAS
jgi:CO dehydrogenase maturation factor